jgi:hypothetical protein
MKIVEERSSHRSARRGSWESNMPLEPSQNITDNYLEVFNEQMSWVHQGIFPKPPAS